MARPAPRSLVLGFLHVARPSTNTYRAGYLLTTDYGRPIEFHYTTQVNVSPLQQALYGATFERILYAEVLAKPMTDRQSAAPQMIVVDASPLLELRRRIPAPVVAVSRQVGEHGIAAIAQREHPNDLAVFEKVCAMTPSGFDWMEPFERIAAALSEIADPATSLAA